MILFYGQINIIMNINWPDLHWQDNAISLRSSSHHEKHFYESDTPPSPSKNQVMHTSYLKLSELWISDGIDLN